MIPVRVEQKMLPLFDRSLSTELEKRNTLARAKSMSNFPQTGQDNMLWDLTNILAIHPTTRKSPKLNKVSSPACEIRLWGVTSLLIEIPSPIGASAHVMTKLLHPFLCNVEEYSWVQFVRSKPDGSSGGRGSCWRCHSSVSGAACDGELLDGALVLLCSKK